MVYLVPWVMRVLALFHFELHSKQIKEKSKGQKMGEVLVQ
jgi:hypothetical protein